MGKYVVFEVSGAKFGLRMEHVSSIEVMQPMTRVPGSKPYVKGVVHLRGKLIPVIDLHLYFDREPTSASGTSKIIVLLNENEYIGILVDEANHVMSIPNEMIEPMAQIFGNEESPYFEGIANLEESIIGILSVEQLLKAARDTISKLKLRTAY